MTTLYIVLQHFRNIHGKQVIWANAICINQTYVQERSHQARLMGDVFPKVVRVSIWLGLDLDLSVLPGHSYQHVDSVRRTDYDCKDLTDTAKAIHLVQVLDILTQYLWSSRLWIVQELLLAKTATIHLDKRSPEVSELVGLSRKYMSRCTDSQVRLSEPLRYVSRRSKKTGTAESDVVSK
jgi:hypothetical protein